MESRKYDENTIEYNEKNNSQYKCYKCQAGYSSNWSLKQHIKTKHQKVLQCNKCDLVFDENFKLENHMATHNVNKEFETYCNYNQVTAHKIEGSAKSALKGGGRI